MKTEMTALVCMMIAGSALADVSVSNYDDLAEDFYGTSFNYNGVTYHSVNNVNGVFPDGETFTPGGGVTGLGDQVIIEDATQFYNEFPSWGSGNRALTFGGAYINGGNVSLGAISTVSMGLDSVADAASLEMAYYENGPWGGIVYHLDAFMNGSLVTSDSFTIAGSDPNGRDNIAFATLSVDGVQFDSLQLYATLGAEYTGPRILVDNLTINTVPAPGSIAMLLGAGGLVARRRR